MTTPSEPANGPAGRACGTCSLCCTVLRVDELAKLGGRPCMHQRREGGCGVYARRPGICRAYRCAWLGGAFGEADRPDRIGAVLDFVPRGHAMRLVVRQATPDAFDRSPRLREVVRASRQSMDVELRDSADVLDPDRPYRVMQADGTDLRVSGSRIESLDGEGRVISTRRAPWAERWVGRIVQRVKAWRLSRWPSHESRASSLAGRGPAPARDSARPVE